jgi:hypothetical protein
MTRFHRLGGMFVSPKATLEYVSAHPDLRLPFMLILVWLIFSLSIDPTNNSGCYADEAGEAIARKYEIVIQSISKE